MFEPAAKATISKRSGYDSATLRVLRPMEPVEPSMAMRRMGIFILRGWAGPCQLHDRAIGTPFRYVAILREIFYHGDPETRRQPNESLCSEPVEKKAIAQLAMPPTSTTPVRRTVTHLCGRACRRDRGGWR